LLHHQGIPWPGSSIYDRISAKRVFQEQYGRVASISLPMVPEAISSILKTMRLDKGAIEPVYLNIENMDVFDTV
jgi:hypothetical protein